MSFFVKVLLLALVPSLLSAMPCPIASMMAKTPAERVQLDYLRANLIFPQTRVGTSFAIFASAVNNNLNLFEVPSKLDQSWKQIVYRKMLQVHKRYNGPNDVDIERAARIYISHLGSAKEIYSRFISHFQDIFKVDWNFAISHYRLTEDYSGPSLFDQGKVQLGQYLRLYAKAIDEALKAPALIEFAKEFKASYKNKNQEEHMDESIAAYAIKKQVMQILLELSEKENQEIYLELLEFTSFKTFPGKKVNLDKEDSPFTLD